jgi:hypothetical protein
LFSNDPLISFDQKQETNPFLTTAKIGTGIAGVWGANRLAMRYIPNFGTRAYNFFSKVEERSPFHILRTFSLSELYSSYTTPRTLEVAFSDLFAGPGLPTEMGQHFQRMLGSRLDLSSVVSPTSPLRFIKSGNSPYMKIEGVQGVDVRFFKAREYTTEFGKEWVPGKITGSSQRFGAPLKSRPFDWFSPKSISAQFKPTRKITDIGITAWSKELFHNLGKAQLPAPRYTEVIGEGFQPGAVKFRNGFRDVLSNLASTTERVGFLMGERSQTLLSDIRLGLWGGSYNRLLHVPFFGGKNRGLINQFLSKRALPIYLGAIGLGFADYLTHHIVSDTAIDVYQKSRVFHARLTDKVPGARAITDTYERIVPGAQYGPIALPLAGGTAGALYHYSKVLRGLGEPERSISASIFASPKLKGTIPFESPFLKIFNKRSPIVKGLLIGLAAMVPFIPGMLGSRKTARELQDIYSGQDPVAIRSGRWWDLGTTPWEGNRIKEYRAHWSVLHRSRAEKISLYGSEEEYWAHHPILHPIKYLKDPYWLEKRHYGDRPYPITSPAFSDVPLIGPLLAATIGKLVKPPVRMHPEWSGDDYDIGSTRLQPRGPDALPPAKPKQEFGFKDTFKREALQFSDLIGLPGFIARTLYNKAYPNPDANKDVYFQGSRTMENASRRYYEKEVGAGLGPNLDLSSTLGYTEPFRRFIQPEPKRITANQIPNQMPSWLPGEDYFLNFRVGDPYAKISEGYARLPGEGYAALHPEVSGLNPEDYPDITRLSILGDVAPYSVEYRRLESAVRRQVSGDTARQIEFEKIVARTKAMKDSVVRTDDRIFSRDVTKATGTVSRVSGSGIELAEFPGRQFNLSAVGYSAADQSAIVLGEHNDWSKAQVASEVRARQRRLVDFFNKNLQAGTKVDITTAAGALDSQEQISAVFASGGMNINKALLNEGLGQYRKDLSGPESQAMFGPLQRLAGAVAEDISFTGDEARWNPLRYLPTPYHTKYWQERTPLSQYQQQEVEGARLRRWQHPIEDFLMPYARGLARRVVGDIGVPELTQKKWDLNTMSDMLEYIRDMKLANAKPELHGRYTSQASRTAIGADLFGRPTFIASTFSGRDSTYFKRFLEESDVNERQKILATVPVEMSRALSAQWVSQQANIARAEGQNVPPIEEGGRLFTEEGLEEYSKADTKLNYGDYQRSKEIAEFFTSRGLNLPEEAGSPLYNPNIDYEDVKLKIVQQEGYDEHDFGLFDDRAALLWRKPYIDGAVRELTGKNRRSVEEVRRSVEEMIMAAHDKNPQVVYTSNQAHRDRSNVRIDVDIDQQKELLQDMRRNPDKYQ